MEQKLIWKEYPLNTTYLVSNYGHVKNKTTQRMIKGTLNAEGYRYISTGRYKIKVHRMVALTFLENDDPAKKFVNHINSNRSDNRLSNLEWCTPSYNVKHGSKSRRGTEVEVDGTTHLFASTSEAAEHLNVKRTSITNCLTGLSKSFYVSGKRARVRYLSDKTTKTPSKIDMSNNTDEWFGMPHFKPYEINMQGDVRRHTGKGNMYTILTSHLKHGYVSLSLSDGGKKSQVPLHRLMALTFITNDDPIKKTQVNHINGNKQDNSLANLEWVTAKENSVHAAKCLPSKNKRQVKRITIATQEEKLYDTVQAAVRDSGLCDATIYKVLNAKLPSCRGFTWRYI